MFFIWFVHIHVLNQRTVRKEKWSQKTKEMNWTLAMKTCPIISNHSQGTQKWKIFIMLKKESKDNLILKFCSF